MTARALQPYRRSQRSRPAPARTLDLASYYRRTGFRYHAGQWQVLADGHRHLCVVCGRRWGKTLAGAKKVEPRCFVQVPDALHGGKRGQLGWIVGPTYADAEREFGHLYDGLRRLGVERESVKFLNNADSGNMHIVTSWGFEVQAKSAAHPEGLVGEGLDFVLMVEAGRHKRSTWAKYVRPTLSDTGGWSLHTGVPEGGRRSSLLYELAQRGRSTAPAASQWATIHAPSWQNTITFPGGRSDPEILDAELDLTEDEFDQQYGAKWVEHAGVVMKDWDDELHIADLHFDPKLPLYWALDYGYRNDFVCLWVQVDEWGSVSVIAEQRWQSRTIEEIAPELAEHPLTRKVAAFYPDPARPDTSATLSSITGVASRPNTGGELIERLEAIWRLLKPGPVHPLLPVEDRTPRLLVDRGCAALIFEMSEGYRWPEHRSEVREDSELPLKRDDHGVEALGRFCRGYFGVSADGADRSERMDMRSRGPADDAANLRRQRPGQPAPGRFEPDPRGRTWQRPRTERPRR